MEVRGYSPGELGVVDCLTRRCITENYPRPGHCVVMITMLASNAIVMITQLLLLITLLVSKARVITSCEDSRQRKSP